MAFPIQRIRRLRQSEAFRDLFCEITLSASRFILPLFVVPGHGIRKEMKTLPGNFHLSVDCLVEEAKAVRDLGIPAVLIFGIPESKDEQASQPYHGMASCSRRSARSKSMCPD